MPYLNRLTPRGLSIGAVNTIVIREENGRRIKYDTKTDSVGIREAILQNARPELLTAAHGRPAMVIGAGGTSRAAVYALKVFLGIEILYIVNHSKAKPRL